MNGGVAGLGHLARGRFTILGGARRPVLVHGGVVVALDAALGEQLGVKLEKRRLVEPLEAFGADVGDHVGARVVAPAAPCGCVECGLDGGQPLHQKLRDRPGRRFDDAAAVGLSHRFTTGLPRFPLGVVAAFGDPWVPAGRRITLGNAEFVVPLGTPLVNSAFHEASSRRPAVST